MKRAVIVAIALLMPATAQAQVSVLGLEADPGATKMAQWVTASIRTWVKGRGMTLGAAKDLLEVKAVFGCEREKASCMAGVAKAMKVRKLIFGKVKLRNRRYVIILKMLDMRSPQNLDTVTQTMAKSDATRSAVKSAAARWAAKLTRTATMGKVRVNVRPSGSRVSVDNKDVGPVGRSGVMVLDLPPGSHTVSVTKQGYKSSSSRIWVRVGRTVSVRFRLRKSRVAVTPRPVEPRPVEPRPVEPRTDPAGVTPTPTVKKKKKTNPKLWWQIAFYGSAGVAVAMGIGIIVTGMKVRGLQDDKKAYLQSEVAAGRGLPWMYVKDVCAQADRDAQTIEYCKDGKKYANMTNGLIAAGVVFAAAAGVFSYFAFVKKYPKEKAEGEGASAPSRPVKFSLTPSESGTRAPASTPTFDFEPA